MNSYFTKTNTLTVAEYQSLRRTTSWEQLPDDTVAKALKQDLFSVSVYREKQVIGMGRVIGDGAIYYYVQDVIVHPDYQKKGIGKLIMESIENYFNTHIQGHAFIGLMAAKDTTDFYQKMGYTSRSDDAPGMFKLISK